VRLAVLQSNYIPWKGYFDIMAMSDVFVIYDSVQYTKNDWRNRNRLMTATGPVWLTIAIATAGRAEQPINEAAIHDPRWASKHWNTVSQALARRPFFDRYRDGWAACYRKAGEMNRLHDVNVLFLEQIAGDLGISTALVDDRTFDLEADTPTGKLVQLCQTVGADRYLTGPAGLSYLDLARFGDAGVAVDVVDYGGYPSYPQTSHPFEHGVSALDLLASVGPDARHHLAGRYWTAE
jgi:hypothetical protein